MYNLLSGIISLIIAIMFVPITVEYYFARSSYVIFVGYSMICGLFLSVGIYSCLLAALAKFHKR